MIDGGRRWEDNQQRCIRNVDTVCQMTDSAMFGTNSS